MIKQPPPIKFLILIFLLFAIPSCSLGESKHPKLGEIIRSDSGGFSLRTVSDYEFSEVLNGVRLMAFDAQEDAGPLIMAHGGTFKKGRSAKKMMNEILEQESDAGFSIPKKVVIGGTAGLMVAYSGEKDGQKVKGKIIVSVPYKNQEFFIAALSPESRWGELEPVFLTVLDSLHFFEAEPHDFSFNAEEIDSGWEWDDDWGLEDDEWD